MNNLAIQIGDTFLGRSSRVQLDTLTGVGSLVSLFVKGAFTISGLAILYFLIIAGIGMIKGAGNSDPKQMEQSKSTATSALIGFIVVFASYWIVKLIEQLLGLELF